MRPSAGRSHASRHELPNGNGPPLYGFSSDVSMLQWMMAIDNDRAYLEDDLTCVCMHQKGFGLFP